MARSKMKRSAYGTSMNGTKVNTSKFNVGDKITVPGVVTQVRDDSVKVSLLDGAIWWRFPRTANLDAIEVVGKVHVDEPEAVDSVVEVRDAANGQAYVARKAAPGVWETITDDFTWEELLDAYVLVRVLRA